MSGRDDLYFILDVVRTASLNDIKRAYRKLARRYHPDINPGDRAAAEQFKRISDAYDVLSSPLKRRFYDENGFYSDGVLDERQVQTSWSFSFREFDSAGPSPSPLGEILGDFFSRHAAARRPERGQDVEYPMSIGFADSIQGLKTRISVNRQHECPACLGAGAGSVSPGAACRACEGSGSRTRMRGRLQFTSACADCGGSGRERSRCAACKGDGRIWRTDILEIAIPGGVSAASRVRFPGEGGAGRQGGAPGDLYVVTNVAPHPFFTRVGDNIQCVLPVTFPEAALGAKIEAPTVDGRTIVRIPPGTQNGQVFRMRGKGAPSLLQPGMRGDQLVEIRVIVPRIADERSKEILREFAALNAGDPRRDLAKY